MRDFKQKETVNKLNSKEKLKRKHTNKDDCSSSDDEPEHKIKESKQDSSSNDESTSSKLSKQKRRYLRRLRREQKKAKKLMKKIKKIEIKNQMKEKKHIVENEEASIEIPIELMAQAKAPMTKEQWEKEQSVVRKVYDESSGRYRLIKGDGEVIEEIVSKERHSAINEQATKGDGIYFQAKLQKKLK